MSDRNRMMSMPLRRRFAAASTVVVSLICAASAGAQSFEPCGGRSGSLWSWGWAGNNGQYVTIENDNFGPRIAYMVDQSGNGNDYFNDDPFNENPPTRPGYQVGFSRSGYSTSLPIVGVNAFSNGTNIYLQFMEQSNPIAAGAFYLAFAGYESRPDGHRVVWGTTSSDRVRLEQVDNQVNITIAGRELSLTGRNAWSDGPVLIEVWRDAGGNLRAWVNGSDKTSGSPNATGTFNMSGIGGGIPAGSSAWDDYAFEYVACDDLPSDSQRAATREYLRSKWNLFGPTAPPPPSPNPPSNLVAE